MQTNQDKHQSKDASRTWSFIQQSFRDIDQLIQLHQAYKKAILMECLKGTGIKPEDFKVFQDVMQNIRGNGESFLDWYLRAEDAIKTLRKNAELEAMEMDERIP